MIYEPIMMREGKIEEKGFFQEKVQVEKRFEKTPKKAMAASGEGEVEASERRRARGSRGKSQGNIIDKVNGMLREFEGEKR